MLPIHFLYGSSFSQTKNTPPPWAPQAARCRQHRQRCHTARAAAAAADAAAEAGAEARTEADAQGQSAAHTDANTNAWPKLHCAI